MDQMSITGSEKVLMSEEGIWSTPKLLFGLIDPRIFFASANVTEFKKRELALRFVVNCAWSVLLLLCSTWKAVVSRNYFWNIDEIVIESFSYFKRLFNYIIS